LVRRAAADTRTAGGLFIPEKAQNSKQEAVVMSVGPGARDQAGKAIPMCVSVGDTVLLPEYGGTKLEMDGEEFQLFRETDIVAKLS